MRSARTNKKREPLVPSEKIAARSGAQVVLGALVCASFFLSAGPAWACGSEAARAAMQSPQVASKFALASKFCGENKESKEGAAESDGSLAPAPSPAPTKVSAPMDPSGYSQQLSMYDNRAATPSESGMTVALAPLTAQPTAPVAPAAPGGSRQLGIQSVPSQPLKGMSRDSTARAIALVPEINRVAAAYEIDPLLLHAIAHVESRHNPDAVSHAGAMGLMQVMPATARRFGVTTPQSQLRNPTISLEVCSAYLKTLQKRFDNNLTLVIAAYNAGEGAVEKYGRRVPPYKETQGYVRDVMAHYLLLVSVRDAGTRAARATL